MAKWAQGKFTVKNTDKYAGLGSPRYRSSWEFAFMKFCDENPSVVKWASESIKIPYRNPFTGKYTVYVPDFFIVYVDKDNQKHALFTHDLLRLADKCNFNIDETHQDRFDQISTFNLNARYDSYKREFYKLCTEEFSFLWKERIETLRLWLIQKF
jgi:hypothetical protein